MLHKKTQVIPKARNSLKSREAWRVNGVLRKEFVKCGKSGCRCNKGRRHGGYWYLTYRDLWGLKRVYVKRKDLDIVRAGLKRGHKFAEQKRQENEELKMLFVLAKTVKRAIDTNNASWITDELLQDTALSLKAALDAEKLTLSGDRYLMQPDGWFQLKVASWLLDDMWRR